MGFLGFVGAPGPGGGGGGSPPGGSNTDVQFNNSGSFGGDSGFTYAGNGQTTINLGTLAADATALQLLATWNNGAVNFSNGILKIDVTDSASNFPSYVCNFSNSGASFFTLDQFGDCYIGNVIAGGWNGAAQPFSSMLEVAATAFSVFSGYRFVNSTNGATITLNKSRNPTIGAHTIVQVGDVIGQFGFNGSDGSNYVSAAFVSAFCDATPSAGIVPGRLRFATGNSAGTLTEAGRIDSNQNWVFGTAALAANATNGFTYLPTCPGAPSGTPTSYSGLSPFVVDSTNNELWFYNANWQPARSRVLLNTLTASNSATLSDTTSFTSAFTSYEIEFENLVPVSSATSVTLQVHSGGVFQTTGYLNGAATWNSSGFTFGASTTNVFIGGGGNLATTANSGMSGKALIMHPSTNAVHLWTGQTGNVGNTLTFEGVYINGCWNTAGAIDGFQISMSSGNISTGIVRVYGII